LKRSPRQKKVHPLYWGGGKREREEGESEGERLKVCYPKTQDENLTPEEREKKVRSVVARLVEKLQIPGAEFQLKTLKAIVNFAKSVDGK